MGGATVAAMRRIVCFIIGAGILGVAAALVIECFRNPSLLLISASCIGVPVVCICAGIMWREAFDL